LSELVTSSTERSIIEKMKCQFEKSCELGEAVRRQHGESEAHYELVLPDAVLFPKSTEEVASMVDFCREHHVPIIPFGAGTSLEGNTLPIHGGVTIDLSNMNQIVEVNQSDFDCVVQAGVRREQLNEHLRDQGLFFPIDPGANATIGGMASTRASGTNAVRYGTMREAILALTVVTPDGKVIKTSARARKSAAGYDLTRLFIGSEGTLGIITEITLRLHGIPETISSAVCAFDSLKGAVDTVVETIQFGVPLARVELLDDEQIRAVNARSGTEYAEKNTLFFEFHGTEASVEEQVALTKELAGDNGGGDFKWSNLPEERATLWKARHEAYYAAVGVRKNAVGLTTDVCVPLGRLVECVTETKADLKNCSVPACIVGHVGDGNFHVIFSMLEGDDDEMTEVEEVNARLVKRAISMEGTCTGEHGIGIGKQEWLRLELGDAVDVMRSIKQTIDPDNLFNPGKIFQT
jgi:D-lactate dehydrogenase (cytochrome)